MKSLCNRTFEKQIRKKIRIALKNRGSKLEKRQRARYIKAPGWLVIPLIPGFVFMLHMIASTRFPENNIYLTFYPAGALLFSIMWGFWLTRALKLNPGTFILYHYPLDPKLYFNAIMKQGIKAFIAIHLIFFLILIAFVRQRSGLNIEKSIFLFSFALIQAVISFSVILLLVMKKPEFPFFKVVTMMSVISAWMIISDNPDKTIMTILSFLYAIPTFGANFAVSLYISHSGITAWLFLSIGIALIFISVNLYRIFREGYNEHILLFYDQEFDFDAEEIISNPKETKDALHTAAESLNCQKYPPQTDASTAWIFKEREKMIMDFFTAKPLNFYASFKNWIIFHTVVLCCIIISKIFHIEWFILFAGGLEGMSLLSTALTPGRCLEKIQIANDSVVFAALFPISIKEIYRILLKMYYFRFAAWCPAAAINLVLIFFCFYNKWDSAVIKTLYVLLTSAAFIPLLNGMSVAGIKRSFKNPAVSLIYALLSLGFWGAEIALITALFMIDIFYIDIILILAIFIFPVVAMYYYIYAYKRFQIDFIHPVPDF